MQTPHYDKQWIKEKLLSDMIGLVKVFSVCVVVFTIVLVTIQFCETAKRDFKLRNIFRFMADKRHKKNKKDIKHLKDFKDFKVHYIEGKNANKQEKLITSESRPQHIHTLMPLPLPVHLPIPSHPADHLIDNHELPPLPPQAFPLIHPEHLSFHQNSHFHDPYLAHPEPQMHSHQISNAHLFVEASDPIIRPFPPPIIITQEFNSMPPPVPMADHIQERISYPVFELLNDESFETIKNTVHPNAHSYQDNDQSIGTNFDDNRKSNHLNDNKQRISKENKRIQTSVRLVNDKKLHTIQNTNLDKVSNQESSHSRKFLKSNGNWKNPEHMQITDQINRNQENQLRPLDNRKDEKVFSQPVPEEQVVNLVEDEWTFKDLDLWIIR